ncbi:class I SAM-dependent methyltransferase [Cyanobium sp. LEGE 06113]|uniref:class I SAM-dependent methyltransferase n=1 Tax=Cyanobium sp. LEGE 06113 TaxID=1297573 RepID=UPI001881F794|nr:class I SAM-dependent methyltransferase [Cyanobium sp. LEGE 06113]MBE9153310.1 class I SAM-dependent methyltransferase [Cyanobium sp. LEGE 06113]
MSDTKIQAAAIDVPIEELIKEFDKDLFALVAKYHSAKIKSTSPVQAMTRGNAYQTIGMREVFLQGFRPADEDIYSGMCMAGQSFVDLGCNLGERTRIAVRNNASFAEGIEYEEFFVGVGALVNIYNKIPRIILRQGDVAQPGCLKSDYDIGACFSAFVYVQKNLEELLGRIKRLFMLETHALKTGWFHHYIATVEPYMPHWIIYDVSGHGGIYENSHRACIAFSRKKNTLLGISPTRSHELGIRNKNIRDIDIKASALFMGMFGESGRNSPQAFQALREELSTLVDPSDDKITACLRATIVELEQDCTPTRKTGFRSDEYWLQLFRGMVEFHTSGEMSLANSYLTYMRSISKRGEYDPGMRRLLLDDSAAADRMRLRIKSFFDILRTGVNSSPIVAFNAISLDCAADCGIDLHPIPAAYIITDKQTRRYFCNWFDGYHRIAALSLSGAKTARCMFSWTNLRPPFLNYDGASNKEELKLSWSDPNVRKVVELTFDQLLCRP